MRQPDPNLCPKSAHMAWGAARAPAPAAYECALITPMYGGGVEPGAVDRDMPVGRVPSVASYASGGGCSMEPGGGCFIEPTDLRRTCSQRNLRFGAAFPAAADHKQAEWVCEYRPHRSSSTN